MGNDLLRKVLVPIIVAVILGISFVFVAEIISNSAIAIKNKGYVKVKGFAKKNITSDLGIFKVTLAQQDKDLGICYTNLCNDRDKVKTFLEKSGFPAKKIRFYPVQIEEVHKINERGFETEELIGYRLTQDIEIKSKDVKKIEKLSTDIAGVISQGVKMFISPPKYIYTKLDKLKLEMIGKATANAKERAEIIAKRGKFRLGPIASVRVGVFQITPAHSTKVSDYGINDTTSIEKEIKSVVEIKYFVR